MPNLTKETKVGMLGTAAIALLFLGFSFLKGSDILKQSRQFYVEYSDIGGLINGDPITFNGQRIGRVQKTYLKEDYNGSVMIVINITDPIDIRKDSKLQIISSDLLGSKAIRFIPGKGEEANSNDTLIGVVKSAYLNSGPDSVIASKIPFKNWLKIGLNQKVYLIELLVSKENFATVTPTFVEIAGSPLWIIEEKGHYKYMLGEYADSTAALSALDGLKKKGFSDASILSLARKQVPEVELAAEN